MLRGVEVGLVVMMVAIGNVSGGIFNISGYSPGDRYPIGKIYSSESGEKIKYGILTNRTKEYDVKDLRIKGVVVEYFDGEKIVEYVVPTQILDKQGNVVMDTKEIKAYNSFPDMIKEARERLQSIKIEERVRQEVEKRINQSQPPPDVNRTSQTTDVNNFSQDLLVKIEEVNATVANLSQRVDEQERRISWLEQIVRKILDWIQRTFGVAL